MIFDEKAAADLDEKVGDLCPSNGGVRNHRAPSGNTATYQIGAYSSTAYVDEGGPSRFFKILKV
jgi:hypothetical protein